MATLYCSCSLTNIQSLTALSLRNLIVHDIVPVRCALARLSLPVRGFSNGSHAVDPVTFAGRGPRQSHRVFR